MKQCDKRCVFSLPQSEVGANSHCLFFVGRWWRLPGPPAACVWGCGLSAQRHLPGQVGLVGGTQCTRWQGGNARAFLIGSQFFSSAYFYFTLLPWTLCADLTAPRVLLQFERSRFAVHPGLSIQLVVLHSSGHSQYCLDRYWLLQGAKNNGSHDCNWPSLITAVYTLKQSFFVVNICVTVEKWPYFYSTKRDLSNHKNERIITTK